VCQVPHGVHHTLHLGGRQADQPCHAGGYKPAKHHPRSRRYLNTLLLLVQVQWLLLWEDWQLWICWGMYPQAPDVSKVEWCCSVP
jgi:hypothetical protein